MIRRRIFRFRSQTANQSEIVPPGLRMGVEDV